MNFSFSYEVDIPNKILICEVVGTINKIIDIEHLLKNIVKLAGKNQLKYVVVDVTQLILNYSILSMTTLLTTMKEEGLLDEIKIARIINPQNNSHHLVGEMSAKYSLPIKNFDNRSDAMLWLLFNK